MCLSTITKEIKSPTKEVRVGWKHFDFDYDYEGYHPEGESFLVFPYSYSDRAEQGKWLRAKHVPVRMWSPKGVKTYQSGFHIYSTKEEARQGAGGYAESRIIKVLFRRLRIVGTQHGRRVFVADEMYIPTEQEIKTGRIAGAKKEKVEAKKARKTAKATKGRKARKTTRVVAKRGVRGTNHNKRQPKARSAHSGRSLVRQKPAVSKVQAARTKGPNVRVAAGAPGRGNDPVAKGTSVGTQQGQDQGVHQSDSGVPKTDVVGQDQGTKN